MFPCPFDDGVSGCLIVASLDVELMEEGLEDQRGQKCHPCLQQVDERRVGTELFEDLLGEASLKEPYAVLFFGGHKTAPKPLSTVL